MDTEKFNFQIDLEEKETTSADEITEGCPRRTIFVEVGPEAFDETVDSGVVDEAAEEIALTTAQELADQELAELKDDGESITPLEELPPVIQDLEPDLREPGIRAWLIKAESGPLRETRVNACAIWEIKGKVVPMPGAAAQKRNAVRLELSGSWAKPKIALRIKALD
jgi:hypothetical protein